MREFNAIIRSCGGHKDCSFFPESKLGDDARLVLIALGFRCGQSGFWTP